MATISLLLYIAGRVADLLRQGANGEGVGEGHLSPPPFRVSWLKKLSLFFV